MRRSTMSVTRGMTTGGSQCRSATGDRGSKDDEIQRTVMVKASPAG